MQYGILDRTWIRKKAIQGKKKKQHCEIQINLVLQLTVPYQGSFENCTDYGSSRCWVKCRCQLSTLFELVNPNS